MGGLLLAVLLASPDSAACSDALRPVPDSLARRAQAVVHSCGALISSPSCREAFGRFHSIGQHPMPLRQLVAACWSAYCRFDVATPCDSKPASNAAELQKRWVALQGAIWRHDAPLDAEEISARLARGSWAAKASAEPIGAMELRIEKDAVVVVARFGPTEQRWTMTEKPREEDYARVQAWLEREVTRSGQVAVAAEPAILFIHVKALMAAIEAAGQPSLTFRVLR